MNDEIIDNELRKIFVNNETRKKLSEINHLILKTELGDTYTNERPSTISKPT